MSKTHLPTILASPRVSATSFGDKRHASIVWKKIVYQNLKIAKNQKADLSVFQNGSRDPRRRRPWIGSSRMATATRWLSRDAEMVRFTKSSVEQEFSFYFYKFSSKFMNGGINKDRTHAKHSLLRRHWPLPSDREMPGNQQNLEPSA